MAASMFASPPNAGAVVALVLIENSQRMLKAWPTLSQDHIPALLRTLREANPVLHIPVLWLPTAPVGDETASIHTAPPRQYNQLPELKFSFNPDNKISSRIINRATELMLEVATQFHPALVDLHLFIVAASPPTQGTWGVSPTMSSQIGQSEWRLLGQRMAQLGIHCHMILPTTQDMSSMSEVFMTSLQLQGHTQVPWFPNSPEYTFLLSGNSSVASSSIPVPDHVPPLDLPAADQVPPLFPVARPPVLRHQSFPQDVQSAASVVQNASTPSLVSSLQRVHGLSRKKLYGTQPPRQPFVREEPVRTKYKSGPTPLSIPVGSQPFPSDDPRAIGGKAKVERGRRVDRLPHIGDMSASTSPGRRSPWNRVSSDVGSSPSSPTTSLSSHHTTSPTIPPFADLAGYPTNPPTTSAGFSPTNVVSETSFSAPLHDGYFAMSPQFQSPACAAMPVSQVPPWTPMKPAPGASLSKSSGTPIAARRHSQELPHGVHMQSLSAMSSKYRLPSDGTIDRPTTTTTTIKGGQQKVKDAGDVPFIFSPELEAATAAKLKAALQSTSTTPAAAASTATSVSVAANGTGTGTGTLGGFPGFTSSHPIHYAVTEDAYAVSSQGQPTTTALNYGQDVIGLGLVNGQGAVELIGDAEPLVQDHARFALVGSSSSLQGWAG